jgi:hypothetical protein
MLRLVGLTAELDLDPDSVIGVEVQPELLDRIATLVLRSTRLTIDGSPIEPRVRRVDFMSVDATGALPRPGPIAEAVGDAVIGVVTAVPTIGMPRTLSFRWIEIPTGIGSIPVTVIDPENVVSGMITVGQPVIDWQYALLEDPIPSVEAVAVEPARFPIPWLASPLLALVVVLAIAAARGRRPLIALAGARIILATAIVVGPVVQTAVALPGSVGRTPSERQARRILAGLLPNVYRALEFRDEATIYDRLAISVTGDALSDVYLEQRRSLEVEERGGAQARVEAVEVLSADRIEPTESGFSVRSEWTVGGMVTHFGHRHFRQNRYNAIIDLEPVDGAWKIAAIEILEQD